MNFFYTVFGLHEKHELNKYPEFKDVTFHGPDGPSHDRLRKTFVAIKDGNRTKWSREQMVSDHEWVCKRSPELFNREPTRIELGVICSCISNHYGIKADERSHF